MFHGIIIGLSCLLSPSPFLSPPSSYHHRHYRLAGAAHLHTTVIDANGNPKVVSDYAKVQGILIGVVAAFVFIVTLVGPENYGSHFENAKTAFEQGGGDDEEASARAESERGKESRPTSVQEVNEKV